MWRRKVQRKHGTTHGSPRRKRTARASGISRKAAKSGCAHEWGGWGRLSEDGPRQHNSDRSEGPWGRAEDRLHGGAPKHIAPDTEQGIAMVAEEHEGRRQTDVIGKASSDSPALKPYRGKPAVRKRVQEKKKLVCSVGDKPTKVIVRGLVAWIAERREIECLMPIDKAIFRMVSKSSGRNESERRFGLEKR